MTMTPPTTPTMRVLHVSEILPGGTATYLQELWHEQRKVLGDEQIRFLLPAAQLGHAPALPASQVVGWDRKGRDPRSLTRLGQALSREVSAFRPDVVHIHGTFAGVVGRAVLAARLRRPKVVYCAHGWSFAMDVSAKKRAAYAGLERLLARAGDGIIAISEDERRLALKAGLPARRVHTITNGIAPDPLGAGIERPTEGPLRLLFAGRHDRQKGLDILLDAMERVGDASVTLDVLGEPLGEDGRPLPSGTTPPLRPGAPVRYLGWTSKDDVARHMAAADAFIMPSRWEGFGLAAIEAMREGTPVIASDRGALPEVVRHGESGLIVPLDVDSLAAVIQTLNRSRLRVWGAQARRDFEQRFTAGAMNARILALYEEVMR